MIYFLQGLFWSYCVTLCLFDLCMLHFLGCLCELCILFLCLFDMGVLCFYV